MEGDVAADGLKITRLKKKGALVCAHPDLSGHHATLDQNSIFDVSTNGTFLNYVHRTEFVPVPAGTGLKFGEVEFTI